ncbi:MAG: thermonuclease family protein [Gammaproteobacteria bacterium]|nr:thermonuclease family protein [Gammaproteobacteria bacterium]
MSYTRITVLLVAVFSLPAAVMADQFVGRVVAVADGDTLTVLDDRYTQHRVRLSGIDAPEKKQAFGAASKKHLSDQVFGRGVLVYWSESDRYGRIIGKVIRAEDGCDGSECRYNIDTNLEQVKAGLAWHYKAYAKQQARDDRALYSEAETEARNRGVGLWADAHPIPPWDFRRRK